jgi:NAD(P)-dependent dehydrogenase (short-subunit alcohol dehydrogenase family)
MTSPAPLAGKTAVVTGASSGIGLPTAVGLARLGASVALVARDRAKGEAALAAVRQASPPGAAPRLFLADLGSLAQVRRLAQELLAALPRIDVLVNNAGAIHATRKASAEGHELTLAVNHLAPFLLTSLLLPRLRASAPARVVTVSSEAHRMGPLDLDDLEARRGYSAMRVYGRSKLANVLFASELARRVAGTGVTSNSLHPGVVATGFGRNDPGWLRLLVTVGRPFLTSPEKGARTSIHVAAAPEVEGVTGKYFKDRRVVAPAPYARDEGVQGRLWELSERLVA